MIKHCKRTYQDDRNSCVDVTVKLFAYAWTDDTGNVYSIIRNNRYGPKFIEVKMVSNVYEIIAI